VSASPPEPAALSLPRLVTERLVLRPPEAADADSIVEGIGDLAVSRMLAKVPHPYVRADAEWWLAHVAEAHAAGKSIHFAITLGDRLVGVISLENFRTGGHFGYWLARPYWGRGYATEAATAFLRHAFETVGVERIDSCVFADNPASLRVQEKLGFRRVGTHRATSLARGSEVDDIDTVLERARFREFAA
jgi:RimJ/RimL family protein N-acetyltransferase